MQEAIRAVVDRIRDRHNARAPAKGGKAATHPLLGDELRALRELKRQSASPFVFASERGGPFTRGASPNSSRVPVTKPRLASRSTRTCSGMPAARRRCGSNASC